MAFLCAVVGWPAFKPITKRHSNEARLNITAIVAFQQSDFGQLIKQKNHIHIQKKMSPVLLGTSLNT